MRQALCTLVMVMMMTGLWVLPATAVSGEMDDTAAPYTVVCVNRTQNAMSTAPAQDNSFHSGHYPTGQGDQMIIGRLRKAELSRVSLVNSVCDMVLEVEPNDVFRDGSVQFIDLPPLGGCTTINGTITVGLGTAPSTSDPNADIDAYRLLLSTMTALTTFVLTLQPDPANAYNIFELLVSDPTIGQFVNDCSELLDGCLVQVTGSAVDFIIAAENSGDYTFTINVEY